MNKGFSLPIVILVTLFISLPVVFFLVSSANSTPTVKGAKSDSTNGMLVKVSSKSGTWDLFEYVCENVDECTQSLTSGRRLETVSGGITDAFDINIKPSGTWGNYKYMKVYVKSGWGSIFRTFNISNQGLVPGTINETIEEEGSVYNIVIIPLDPVKLEYYNSVHFTD